MRDTSPFKKIAAEFLSAVRQAAAKRSAAMRTAGQAGGIALSGAAKPPAKKLSRRKKLILAVFLALFATTVTAGAAGTLEELVATLFGESAQTVDIIILLTILTLLPSIVIMLTGFTRIIIVLSFLRNALGMQQTPPNQVITGLALFLTFFVMQPVLTNVYENAYIPYSEGQITQEEFLETAMVPTREFMLKQTYISDLNFFIGMSGQEITEVMETPNSVLIPAFLTSEIKRAFQMGFFIYIPFIVIDMVVASTLMAMGMMMLPPAMISLPFKVVLFVMVDGWQLVMGTVVQSFL